MQRIVGVSRSLQTLNFNHTTSLHIIIAPIFSFLNNFSTKIKNSSSDNSVPTKTSNHEELPAQVHDHDVSNQARLRDLETWRISMLKEHRVWKEAYERKRKKDSSRMWKKEASRKRKEELVVRKKEADRKRKEESVVRKKETDMKRKEER